MDFRKKMFGETTRKKQEVVRNLFPQTATPSLPKVTQSQLTPQGAIPVSHQAPPLYVVPLDEDAVEASDLLGRAPQEQPEQEEESFAFNNPLRPRLEQAAPGEAPSMTVVIKPKAKHTYTAAELKELGLDK